jgi:hypothetical protein
MKCCQKYDISLTFSLIDFVPSREIECVVAVDEKDCQSHLDTIFGQDLQQAMGMDIFFSSQQLRWDGIEVPIKTSNPNLIDSDKMNSTKTLMFCERIINKKRFRC